MQPQSLLPCQQTKTFHVVCVWQDVHNPQLDISKARLSHDSVAKLVDGWIKGSDGQYATG